MKQAKLPLRRLLVCKRTESLRTPSRIVGIVAGTFRQANGLPCCPGSTCCVRRARALPSSSQRCVRPPRARQSTSWCAEQSPLSPLLLLLFVHHSITHGIEAGPLMPSLASTWTADTSDRLFRDSICTTWDMKHIWTGSFRDIAPIYR